MSELSNKALQVAISQIGQKENPLGSNWGHPVQDYLASVGIGFAASWCMAFVFWCYDQDAKNTGSPANPLFKTGGVLKQYQMRQDNIVKGIPQAGDITIMEFHSGEGHTGIVESVDTLNNIIHTIEGNTNNNGSREGVDVERKSRPINTIKAFLRF